VSAVAAMALVAAACGGGGSSSKTPKAPATPAATQTPVHAGIVTPLPFTPGANLTDQDLEARGHGQPGRGEFDGEKLIIPSINVDAPFTVKTVPGKGGNIVLAGHVDYIHHGPAVFWDLRKLQPGDKVQIQMKDGSVATYEVVFNKFVDADTADFNKITAATAQESVTLVTCTGDFNNGHYNERQIVWAKRV
jgi:LPXTG-site transpeptidase (sortase) family protein